MTEHPTKQELDEYCRRVLAPATFLSVHQHVTACQHCTAECNSPEDLSRDLSHLYEALLPAEDETVYHLAPSEVLAYRAGTLDEIDLEIAESHLSNCSTCLGQVQQATTEDQMPAQIKPSLSSPELRQRWNPRRLAAAVLLGIVLIVFALWLIRSKPTGQNDRTAGPPGTSTPQSSSTVEAQSSRPGEEDVPTENELPLVLNDGGTKVTMDKQGILSGLERLPPHLQVRIGVALKAGRLERPDALSQLVTRRSILLGESGDGVPFRLLGPLGQMVRAQQPTFRWSAVPGAQSYKVIVTDADLNEVATSPALNTTEWQINQPLLRGQIYSWQVTAMKGGLTITSPVLPAPQAKFKVIDAATLKTLQQVERAYPNSHLILGIFYAEAGLFDDAERELLAFVRNNPRVPLAHKLLRSAQAMRRA